MVKSAESTGIGYLTTSAISTEDVLKMSTPELFSTLHTLQSGITTKEAKKLIALYGYNELAKRERRTLILSVLSHLKNPLIIILLIAGTISAFFGEVINAGIIFAMVLLSVVMDTYQESKAEKAADKLKESVVTTATVTRDGIKKEIKIAEIVPGDIIDLSAGDMVPADARLISDKDLYVDQSALTGESYPASKNSEPLTSKVASITEWNNYVFMGTSVVSGTGIAVVLKTGRSTEYGKISEKLVAREPETEFETSSRKFGLLITQAIFVLVLFVFFVNALFKHSVLDSFLFAIALAVGLTPELLPMIISINLSKGALEMSKRGVIVKKLSAIQNFGSMDVLCSDKTGTLTENKIALIKHINIKGKDDEKVLFYSFLNSSYETGLKSPLDAAILAHEEIKLTGYQKIDEIPFDFNRKRVSVIVEKNKKRNLVTKGAPEEILKICKYYELNGKVSKLTDKVKNEALKLHNELSSEGFRILGVAYKKMSTNKECCEIKDEKEMILLGFVTFIDPPKESTKESIKLLNKSGVELKILTGDNELVTKKICEQLDFKIKGIVLGSEIATMNNDALKRVVETANVFARVTPDQKDRIMGSLRSNGHVVGFLGDGINDAPSIRSADVGISVNNAVDVAKESADIILLKKDLTVLQQGVLEGRKTFGNTTKYIVMGTSSNFGNMFSVAGASLFLPFLPMLPTQILLNNFLYDLSEVTIPTDNVDEEYIQKPKKFDISFVKRFMLIVGPISSIFDFLTFFILLAIFKAGEPLFQTFWFIESLCTQTLVIFIIRTQRTPFFKSKSSKLLLLSSLAVVAFAILMPFTPLGALFKFVQPPLELFVALFVLVAAYLGLVEVVKYWFYKHYYPTDNEVK